MHGAVLLDGQGRPLRPAILWNDARAASEAEELQRDLPAIGDIAGITAMASFVVPKLRWLGKYENETLVATRHILLPKDYIRLQLTGTYATDKCDAAGSLLLDEKSRAWSSKIAEACGIPLDVLPTAMEGNEISGHLTKDAAAALGLRAGIPVAAGAGDAAAGSIGIGAVNEGDSFISLGTAAQYFITRNSYVPRAETAIHTFCHGLPGRWFQMAALLNGAICLSWLASVTANGEVEQLLREAEGANENGLLFLPYLGGERTPHNDPMAKGVFFGLTPATTRADMTRAVLDGVALSLADCQEHLASAGPLPDQVAVVGGGGRSQFWMQRLANALGKDIVLYAGAEIGPAFGAARLARLCLGRDRIEAVCRKPDAALVLKRDPAQHAVYRKQLARFRALYATLRPHFSGAQ
jgi:xylulokinase